MTRDELNKAYFEWMYSLVCDDEPSYRELFHFLHGVDFTYTIDMDGNRFDDGVNLRYRFADESGYNGRMGAKYLDSRPCSVLEMLLALAIRLEEHIMSDPEQGDRTRIWFWTMLSNLELDDMIDSRFDANHVENAIQKLLNREYGRDGKGGLFRIKHCKYDLRNVEIWYQANWYLNGVK